MLIGQKRALKSLALICDYPLPSILADLQTLLDLARLEIRLIGLSVIIALILTGLMIRTAYVHFKNLLKSFVILPLDGGITLDSVP